MTSDISRYLNYRARLATQRELSNPGAIVEAYRACRTALEEERRRLREREEAERRDDPLSPQKSGMWQHNFEERQLGEDIAKDVGRMFVAEGEEMGEQDDEDDDETPPTGGDDEEQEVTQNKSVRGDAKLEDEQRSSSSFSSSSSTSMHDAFMRLEDRRPPRGATVSTTTNATEHEIGDKSTAGRRKKHVPPELDLTNPQTKARMEKIASAALFVWSRTHRNVSYRQGMHELMRIVIIVVMRGRRYFQKTSGGRSEEEDEDETVEAECYFIFSGLMAGDLERLYDPHDPEFLSETCARVQSTLLGRAAPDLRRRFQEWRITPNVYMVRWLRCLFTREFSLERSLQVMDALLSFACESVGNGGMSVLDAACFIALAMLVSLKDRLMSCLNSSEALKLLLNYPRPAREGLRELLGLASNLRALGDVPVVASEKPSRPAVPPHSAMTKTPSIPPLDKPTVALLTPESRLRLAKRLERCVALLEAEMVKSPGARDERSMFIQVAKIKQVKDVLLDRIRDFEWGDDEEEEESEP